MWIKACHQCQRKFKDWLWTANAGEGISKALLKASRSQDSQKQINQITTFSHIPRYTLLSLCSLKWRAEQCQKRDIISCINCVLRHYLARVSKNDHLTASSRAKCCRNEKPLIIYAQGLFKQWFEYISSSHVVFAPLSVDCSDMTIKDPALALLFGYLHLGNMKVKWNRYWQRKDIKGRCVLKSLIGLMTGSGVPLSLNNWRFRVRHGQNSRN